MTLTDRAELYSRTFPKYPRLHVDKGWLMGVWVIGQLWKRTDPTIYGGYPGNYLKRVLSMFPDASKRLDVFAGNTPTSPGAVRVDMNPLRRPSVLADARRLPFAPNTFDFVVADPPYSSEDAKRYGYPMVSRRHVMHELRSVVVEGGWLCWLDTVRPMYRRQDWEQVGAIAVTVSTNTRTRLLSIFKAQADTTTSLGFDHDTERL